MCSCAQLFKYFDACSDNVLFGPPLYLLFVGDGDRVGDFGVDGDPLDAVAADAAASADDDVNSFFLRPLTILFAAGVPWSDDNAAAAVERDFGMMMTVVVESDEK